MTDQPIRVSSRGFRLRPSDGRALTKATGRTLNELLSGSDMADQLQAFAFIELRRRDRDNGAERDPLDVWAAAEEADIEMDSPDDVPTPDPLGEVSS